MGGLGGPELSPAPSAPSSSVLVEHFEDLLHERFGETDYWDSRYSMVYAAHLREAGRRFMAKKLGYEVPEGGRGREKAKDGGGEYLSVHLRRFVRRLQHHSL